MKARLLRRFRLPLMLAVALPLAGCGDCLNFSWGGGSDCSTTEGIVTIAAMVPVAVVALPVVLLADAADRATSAEPSPNPATPQAAVQPALRLPRAVRECREEAATCEVRISCPTGAAQCRIPAINQTCPDRAV